MPNPITVGFSPLTSKIYAGRSKPLKGNERARIFTGEKFDVTDEALVMVAHKLKHDGEPVRWELADETILTLTASVSAPGHEKTKHTVIPDGWMLVPVEPTESMITDGFESEPDESFSDDEAWEAYKAMSGCQQAAHRAKLCWAAMLAAAPKPKVEE